jgi:antitoxin CptB
MQYNRLKWAARRGMLELDLILQPFVDNVYLTLPEAEQSIFTQLLSCEDQDLFAWLIHRDEPSRPELQVMVRMIRDYARQKPQH